MFRKLARLALLPLLAACDTSSYTIEGQTFEVPREYIARSALVDAFVGNAADDMDGFILLIPLEKIANEISVDVAELRAGRSKHLVVSAGPQRNIASRAVFLEHALRGMSDEDFTYHPGPGLGQYTLDISWDGKLVFDPQNPPEDGARPTSDDLLSFCSPFSADDEYWCIQTIEMDGVYLSYRLPLGGVASATQVNSYLSDMIFGCRTNSP